MYNKFYCITMTGIEEIEKCQKIFKCQGMKIRMKIEREREYFFENLSCSKSHYNDKYSDNKTYENCGVKINTYCYVYIKNLISSVKL